MDRFAAPNAYTPRHLVEKILTSRRALEGERRPVTVLFCDIADSTALAMRLGPEEMHALLGRFFDLALDAIHRYEGTVNQFLGDGLMALFGAPVAHEDHPRRAVLAALGIQQALARRRESGTGPAGGALDIRMGLNTGIVLVGAIGDNLRMDYTAVGDTTHLAARLQQAAEPGTILVSEASRRLVETAVRVEPVGPLLLKGWPNPVPAYRVVGVAPRRSPVEAHPERPLSRFAGRERQVETLAEALMQAERGQGQVVGIVAEPGAGKSRLLYEFRARLGEGRVTYLEGRCLSYATAIPLVPVLDVLRQYCAVAEADPPGTVADKIATALAAADVEPADVVPYLMYLMGVKHGPEPPGTPETIRTRAFELLRQVAFKASRRQPLVLVFEDLHWIDRTSEEFLASLIENLASARIVLLATYRPGYRPLWIDRSYASQIALQPLSGTESRLVLESILESVTDPLARLILGKAEGNPFFIEELASAMRDNATGGIPAVPDTIQGVLMARIDRLSESSRRLLQGAAVLGREVPRRLLEATWDEEADLDRCLAELTRLEFIHTRADPDELVYVFKHALTQDVAYHTLVTPRRRALHARAGSVMEQLYPPGTRDGLLAHHFREAGDLERALRYHRRAAEAAGRVYAVQEALDHYTGALEVAVALGGAVGDEARRALALERGRVHAQTGDVSRARADFEAALAAARAAGDRRTEMRALDELGFLLAGAADYREGTPYLEAALAIADELGDGPARATILSRLSIMEANRLEFDVAVAHAHRAIEYARALDDARSLDRALDSLLVSSMMLGDLPTAESVGATLVERLRGSADLWYLQFALLQWATAATGAARWEDGLRRLREALEINRRIGDRANEAMFLTIECWHWRSRGEYGRALAPGRQALDLAARFDHAEWTAFCASMLGWVLEDLGAFDEAARYAERGLVAAERAGSPYHTLNLAGQLAWASFCLGDRGRSRALAARAEEIVTAVRTPPGYAVLDASIGYLGLARVYLADGEPARAERLLRPFAEAAGVAGWHEVFARAALLIAACQCAEGDAVRATVSAAGALDVARRMDLPGSAWPAHALLAALAMSGGRSDEAAAHRKDAAAIVERLAAAVDEPSLRATFLAAAARVIDAGDRPPEVPG